MKKQVMILLMASAMFSTLSAREFDDRLQSQCQYNLTDSGRYNDVASGYLMGVVVGMNYLIPAEKRSEISQKRLGYISDKACQMAMQNHSDTSFESRYKAALYSILVK